MKTQLLKTSLLCLALLLGLAVLFSFSLRQQPGSCSHVPPLNKKVVAYVKSMLDKQVGTGECWDLAAEALNNCGANWDHDYVFGKEIDPTKSCVFPGDVIQFDGVVLEYKQEKTRYTENLEHHTAIVYQVKSKGNYIIAQQNTDTHGRKVGLDPFQLSSVIKGKYVVFRPTK